MFERYGCAFKNCCYPMDMQTFKVAIQDPAMELVDITTKGEIALVFYSIARGQFRFVANRLSPGDRKWLETDEHREAWEEVRVFLKFWAGCKAKIDSFDLVLGQMDYLMQRREIGADGFALIVNARMLMNALGCLALQSLTSFRRAK